MSPIFRSLLPLLLLVSFSPFPALSEQPSDWLPTEGKNDKWLTATARCRDLLETIDPQADGVAPFVERIQRNADILRRTPQFNWKSICAVEYLEGMLEDVLAGKHPDLRYRGKGFGFPYWSDTMDQVEVIWLHMPERYDPTKQHQVFVCYKMGGGIHYKNGKATGGHRPAGDIANQTDTFFCWSSLNIQIKGRMGAQIELAEATAAMAEELAISRDRVFLTGYSDGGFTALFLASRYPNLVAGIAPSVANWQYSNIGDISLYNVPYLVVDGWGDSGYINRNITRWHVLRNMGSPVQGIIGHHGHNYAPWEDIDYLTRILDWASKQKRDLHPKRIRYATWNLLYAHSGWATIVRMIAPALPAQIDITVQEGNRIDVKAWNVGAVRLALGDAPLDPQKPVLVLHEGKEVYSGPASEDLLVELTPAPEGPFRKTNEMSGGILAQLDRSTYDSRGYAKIPGRQWLWVNPTGCDEQTRKTLRRWWPKYAKADTDVTEDDLKNRNLFLFGGPDINKLSSRIADALPVSFGEGSFTIGTRTYDEATACVKFIHPNPLNPEKYIILYAFNDAEAFAKHDFFGTRSESVWGFRDGDCVVMGLPRNQGPVEVHHDGNAFGEFHTVFDPSWQPARQEPLGTLTEPMDSLAVLRLQADAMREAADADVGVVFSHAPSWLTWRRTLPAGPVTLDDLASLTCLPQYVTVGECDGNTLRNLLGRAAAHSAIDSAVNPAGEDEHALRMKDIDPKKTYTLAMNYFGLPSYGVNAKEMPKYFEFASVEDFLSAGHTSLPVRTMRQLPMDITEAVATFIRSRGQVAPRRSYEDLAAYLMNPAGQEYPAYDWIHMPLVVDWPASHGRSERQDRYSLALGVREAGSTDIVKNGTGYKQILEATVLGNPDGKAEFASLARSLPVELDWSISEQAIVPQEGEPSVRVTKAGSDDSIGSVRTLRLTIRNRGNKDLEGLLALCPEAIQRIHGTLWPNARKHPETAGPLYYAGYHAQAGPRKKPPVHERAVLLATQDGAPNLKGHSIRNAGYNFGLVGATYDVSIPAGQTRTIPLLMVHVEGTEDAPPPALVKVLGALKADMVGQIGDMDQAPEP